MKVLKSFLLLFFFLVNSAITSAQMVIDSTKIVRVLSYNIYHGETVGADEKFDLDLLAKVINDVQPDLVALQEVDNKTKRARNYDLVTELGLRTKMAPLFGKAMDFDGGGYGEGVLSRYSFLSTQNHALPARENKEPRAALEVQVQLKSGDTIWFVGTHLDHTKDATDRINQAVALNELFSDSDLPTILTGDLNAEPTSEAMQVLFKDWEPSFKFSDYTYPADNPTKKIDYILFRPAHRWRIIESRVIDEKIASDHRPILTVLELQ
ncbi:endonuclease/exonuclease/phosphatase family protein [Urechidicola vernalis]|uniref:Endonuclease/exonuclease/phosphatase family protein n=1 Tax=Urechidicola vernalis TaxID=3075600 RepID=A0ABU2Y643_9FLAO|nr:endonuclease/exonuclease/phosphatase family protein [Urechidicola sp. P050]MDT0553157.1 endonuclease/exonuclease/phosphatase family protein [Urechidicola sp. P050]